MVAHLLPDDLVWPAVGHEGDVIDFHKRVPRRCLHLLHPREQGDVAELGTRLTRAMPLILKIEAVTMAHTCVVREACTLSPRT